MPKRTDIKSVLIIGAGPIVIGQACEFDYSGAQACKALRDEGYRVVLVNSNPATIMTDPAMADATYIEPVEWRTVAQIIERERPDALLPTMGGQTALNCALDLVREGVLEKFGVELIGASQDAIDKAEDRERFGRAMKAIGLETPRNAIAHSLEEALQVQSALGFPCVIRPSFTLGGSGGGIAYNREEFVEICTRGFDLSPTNELLIDESLLGWKEFEMEVVRDKLDNCIIVCSIENLDPMGIHTGDSITVAPAQTLTDKEYQILRNASIAVLREIGVETGGSNVQFAIDPKTGRMVVIEMNPRVSRSSALASKATGFPIAKVAAKLAVGYTLDELTNDITGVTPASFEPAIDYVVTKIPRFTFEKFPNVDARLTTQMKSVGEVMAIGRTFQESFQKALRGLEISRTGLNELIALDDEDEKARLIRELKVAGADRIWYVADAFRSGMSIADVGEFTAIDPWFLAQIEDLVRIEQDLKKRRPALDRDEMFRLKRKGFSDARLGELLGRTEADVRGLRKSLGIKPVFKRVDTCAAEFPSATAYMYSTYEEECEAAPTDRRKIMVLGGGPNRIGQGIEFDYCCVHAALAMREDGYETIMVNCNPETVSTDYDTSDRLYFEPVTLEDVLEIVEVERPTGVIVQFGGQTPLKLVDALEAAGVPIIGTSADSIDRAEDRQRFQEMAMKVGLLQPENRTVATVEAGIEAADAIGFPMVVRPSYVLGGRAMEVVHNKTDLARYLRDAFVVSNSAPVLLDHFLDQAIEVDVDAVCDGEQVVIGAIMQHIEQAGVHSGDSACSSTAVSSRSAHPGHDPSSGQGDGDRTRRHRADERADGRSAGQRVRARSEPARVAHGAVRFEMHRRFAGENRGALYGRHVACRAGIHEGNHSALRLRQGIGVPVQQVPRRGSDPRARNEIDRRGDGCRREFCGSVCQGDACERRTSTARRSCVPQREVPDKPGVAVVGRDLVDLGFELVATRGTARMLTEAGVPVEVVNKVTEGRPDIADLLKNAKIDLIVNTTEGRQAIADSAVIRRLALQNKVCYTTTLAGGEAFCIAIRFGRGNEVRRLQDLHASIQR